jgi:phosphatidate cytidylyltransferase
MAGPQDQRRPEGEDLFEDLDQFFAPLNDPDWPEEGQTPPEGEPAPGETEGTAAEEGIEDWDVEIEVPAEEELVAEEPVDVTAEDRPEDAAEEGAEEPAAEAPSEVTPEAVEVGAERAEEPVDVSTEGEAAEGPAEKAAEEVPAAADLTEEDLAAAPPEYEDLPAPEEDAEDLFAEPETVSEPVDTVGAAAEEEDMEGEPERETVEAAADHFATGMRPEEVEEDLLADLDEPGEPVTVEAGAPIEGPTWQEGAEPTDVEVEGAPPAPERNLFAAFASGILLAIAVIALLVIGKGPFAVFVSIVVLLGQAELYAVMRARQLQPATLLALVCGAVILAGAYLHGPAAAMFGLVLAAGLTVPWYMAAPASTRRNTAVNAGATILGVAYVPFLASFALLLLAFPGDLGRNVFMVVLGLTVLYDVIAYAVGTLWGNRPLAPTISPNKSWEGVIGATLGVLIVALAVVPAIEPFTSFRAVGLALVIAVVAPLGDLVESALKRDLGVKDMGTILPGHGGILDRVDALLFAVPAAYYFLQASF